MSGYQHSGPIGNFQTGSAMRASQWFRSTTHSTRGTTSSNWRSRNDQPQSSSTQSSADRDSFWSPYEDGNPQSRFSDRQPLRWADLRSALALDDHAQAQALVHIKPVQDAWGAYKCEYLLHHPDADLPDIAQIWRCVYLAEQRLAAASPTTSPEQRIQKEDYTLMLVGPRADQSAHTALFCVRILRFFNSAEGQMFDYFRDLEPEKPEYEVDFLKIRISGAWELLCFLQVADHRNGYPSREENPTFKADDEDPEASYGARRR
ncbi:hypothetical protein F5B20DRAFT_578671 [Whalleya microplaca]|nr:hypothetical protein F5B20DRAFT_578671 [Whalleya microplaca]